MCKRIRSPVFVFAYLFLACAYGSFGQSIGVVSSPVSLQSGTPQDSSIHALHWSRLAGIGVGTTATAVGLHIYQMNTWWAEDRGRFHFQNDWRYALWADKLGHAFAGMFITDLYGSLFRWSGMRDRQALWWGAGVGLAYLTYVEILDGFGSAWGFSPGDQLFNTLGVTYPILQEYYPFLQDINLKVSYWPTGLPDKAVFDDYTGQTYWLTFNLNGLLPDRPGDIFPAWLNVTVAYAAREPDPYPGGFLSESQVFLGLDIEPLGIPIDHPVWNAVARWLHYLHLPAPALRITPGFRFLPFAY